MLRFADTPDRIFTEILHYALGETHFLLGLMEEDQDYGLWESNFPNAARCFTGKLAATVIKDLLAASQDESALYQITDYHWLLIHDCLLNFCEVFNDTAKDEDRRIGDTDIQEVDFDWIIGAFFWDVDFLFPPDVFTRKESIERARLALVNDEAFGIAFEMAPHPDELKMEKEDLRCVPEDALGVLYYPDSVRYPDLRDEDGTPAH